MVLFHPTSNPPFSPTGLRVRPKWLNSERYLIEVWDERYWRTTVKRKMRRMCLVSVMEVLMLINISCEMETVMRYIYLILSLQFVHTPEDEGMAKAQSQYNYTISKLDGRIFTISV